MDEGVGSSVTNGMNGLLGAAHGVEHIRYPICKVYNDGGKLYEARTMIMYVL